MRIKLILENDIGIKKRKLWYLVDEGRCAKVADISYLLKKRFYTCDGKISLSLDGFFIPPQEDINIIRDNDTVTVKFSPESTERDANGNYPEKKKIIQHAPRTSSSNDSSSESGKDTKLVNNHTKNASKVLPSSQNRNQEKIPVKKTVVKNVKSVTKPSDVLKKVASTIPTKIHPIKIVNLLTKGASSLATKRNINKTVVPNNVIISKPVTKKTIPLSKLSVSNVTKKDSSSDSTDTSSSSTDEESEPVKKKVVPQDDKKKVVTTNKPVFKKTIPINTSKVSNVTNKDSSTSSMDSSSSSTDEETQPVKKKMVHPVKKILPADNKKKTVLSDNKKEIVSTDGNKINDVKNSNVKSSILANKGNENKKNIERINSINSQKVTKKSSSSSSDSSDSSSDSSDYDVSKKVKVNVDFQVSKLSKDKNLSDTRNVRSTDNNIGNKSRPVNAGNSKAKMPAKDVYKNKSLFVISKPFAMDKTEKSSTAGSLDGEVTSENSFAKDVDAFSQKNDCVSGKTLRRRRRTQIRKENRRNRELSAKTNEQVELKVNGSASVTTNGHSIESFVTENSITEDNTTIALETKGELKFNCSTPIATNGIEAFTMVNERNGSIIIEDHTVAELESKLPSKNYNSFEKLTGPPAVGSIIGYKILEMSTITYTPEVSDYKEACMKSYNKEMNILELELSEESQNKNKSDSQVKGKFEMPTVSDEEDEYADTQKTMLVSWSELIEPCLVI